MTPDLEAAPVSVRGLAELTGIPRETITATLTEQGITLGRGAKASVPLGKALRVLLAARGKIDPSLLSPRERDQHFAAMLKEQEFLKRQGRLLDRAMVEEAQSRAMHALVQGLRMFPDRFERRFGLDVVQLEAMSIWLDDEIEALGNALEKPLREHPLKD